MHTVDALATLEVPSKTISRLVSLPPPTASLRLMWNHPAVTYINDVEKDRKYQQFGRELREMTRQNMWGQMSFCRRNVLNMVFVVDPTTALGQAVSDTWPFRLASRLAFRLARRRPQLLISMAQPLTASLSNPATVPLRCSRTCSACT